MIYFSTLNHSSLTVVFDDWRRLLVLPLGVPMADELNMRVIVRIIWMELGLGCGGDFWCYHWYQSSVPSADEEGNCAGNVPGEIVRANCVGMELLGLGCLGFITKPKPYWTDGS